MSSASHSLPRPLYRARQFFASLRPRVGDEERRRADDHLGNALFPLFQAMAPRDQRHCLDVFQALRSQGYDDRDLLTAALLHDAGKGDVHLWQRVAYVLLTATVPSLLGRLAAPGAHGWRAGLAAIHHHDERGSRLVAAAGAPDAVVRLIRGEPADPRLALLRAADDSC